MLLKEIFVSFEISDQVIVHLKARLSIGGLLKYDVQFWLIQGLTPSCLAFWFSNAFADHACCICAMMKSGSSARGGRPYFGAIMP